MKSIMIKFSFLAMMFYTTPMYAQLESDLVFILNSGTQTDMNSLTPTLGMLIYNTTDKKVYYYNGAQWKGIDKPRVLPKSANYTLQTDDDGVILTFDSTTDITLTIPAGLPIGYNVSVYQINTGKVLVSSAAGVSIKNRLSRFKTAGKDAGIGIVSTANDVYHVTGDLKK